MHQLGFPYSVVVATSMGTSLQIFHHYIQAEIALEVVMDSSDLPFDSELYGAPITAKAERFGYLWVERSFGIGALYICWDDNGVGSLSPVATCTVNHPSFDECFASSKGGSWFKLVEGEYFTQIRIREANFTGQITGLCFHTNFRRSQWYGAAEGDIRTITAPRGYYIHTIHGSQVKNECQNVGAYLVPLRLRESYQSGATWVADSKIIGDVEHDTDSEDGCELRLGTIRAVVVSLAEHLERVCCLDPVTFQRYLAVTERPLDPGETMLSLLEDELITELRACVVDGRASAIRFITTHRTTEWFGPHPGADAVIESRSVDDAPGATHIGGLFMMVGRDHIKSIGAVFHKKAD